MTERDPIPVICQAQRRAKGIHGGGCPYPTWCLKKGECQMQPSVPRKVIVTRIYKSSDTFGGNVPPQKRTR